MPTTSGERLYARDVTGTVTRAARFRVRRRASGPGVQQRGEPPLPHAGLRRGLLNHRGGAGALPRLAATGSRVGGPGAGGHGAPDHEAARLARRQRRRRPRPGRSPARDTRRRVAAHAHRERYPCGRALAPPRRSRGAARPGHRSRSLAPRSRAGRHEPPRRRRRARPRSAPPRAPVSLRGTAPARERPSRRAARRTSPASAQDPLARRNHPHPHGAPRAPRAARPPDSAAPRPPGPLPRLMLSWA